MKPVKSYCIWFSPRTGSTLLCKALESTGLAGKPQEFFNLAEGEKLQDKYGTDNFTKLRDRLWNLGATPNQVFGMKYSIFTSLEKQIYKEIPELLEDSDIVSPQEAFQSLFPDDKHIYLSRRNKIRQAVSWWKAINEGVWHLEKKEEYTTSQSFYKQHYDFNAMLHLLKEIVLREAATEAYFAQNSIDPLTIVYEDFIREYEKTVLKVLEYLEIKEERMLVDEMYYRKNADQFSEEWVERFREELQSGWDKKIW